VKETTIVTERPRAAGLIGWLHPVKPVASVGPPSQVAIVVPSFQLARIICPGTPFPRASRSLPETVTVEPTRGAAFDTDALAT
jgi:hypothetical protein